MINHHKSFPSIVMYVVFNEGWGQYEVLQTRLCPHSTVLHQPCSVILMLALSCSASHAYAHSGGLLLYIAVYWPSIHSWTDSNRSMSPPMASCSSFEACRARVRVHHQDTWSPEVSIPGKLILLCITRKLRCTALSCLLDVHVTAQQVHPELFCVTCV